MDKIYLDNAATTPLAPEVLAAMMPYLTDFYGNPSSVHSIGRKAKVAVENSRKTIADFLNCSTGEVFFTSGGSEADNHAIVGAVRDLGIERIITSPLEHHAVIHTCDMLAQRYNVEINNVAHLPDGHVDLTNLEELLKNGKKTLVSLMFVNNEIGNLLPLAKVGTMCRQYGALFHSDTVQAMGHHQFDLSALKVDFLTCSAHKFHGPKGVGFLYINSNCKLNPLIFGGSQERNMRGGTENTYGIVGLAKAFEICQSNIPEFQKHLHHLKHHMMSRFELEMHGTSFNGDAKGSSLNTILNVHFPPSPKAEMILYNMDIAGISCSGGSACTSGSTVGSYVLEALGINQKEPNIRFSFSRNTTIAHIDAAVNEMKKIYGIERSPLVKDYVND